LEALTKIKNKYPNLSEVNKRIADYILRNTESFYRNTASEIASKTKTSPASVIRFAKHMGYEGLDGLKLSLASDQGAKKNNKNIDPIISANDSIDELCEKVELLVNDTTTDVFSTVDRGQLAAAIESVKKARKVYLFGIGASSLIAYDLYHKFNRAGFQANYNFDVHMSIEFLNYGNEQDVLIAVTYSGHTKEILLACEIAKKKNIHIIMITRNDSQKIQDLSNEILLVPNNEYLLRVGAISSLVSSMIIGNVLYLGAIQDHIGDEIEERMMMTKKWISELKEE